MNSIPFPKPSLPKFASTLRRLKLISRHQDTPDTVTFTFQSLEGPVQHLPGQAIALDLPMAGGTATRTFTIASAPLGASELSVTVKAAETGNATRWMHDHLEIGTEIDARGPFGRFSLAARHGRPVLLIGGGSGFTPMMSMLRWLHARGEAVDVVVVQVARRVEDLLFGEELEQIDRDMSSLKLFEVVTAPDTGEFWRGYRGRPNRAMLRTMVPDASQCEVYCCGPEGFLDTIRRSLQAEGLPHQHFHTESFGTSTAAVRPEPTEHVAANTHRVTLRGRSIEVADGEILSTALASQNIRVPTGCNAGQCGTCRLRLSEGSVDMRQDGGLSAQEVASGYILACCSRLTGPITLEDLC